MRDMRYRRGSPQYTVGALQLACRYINVLFEVQTCGPESITKLCPSQQGVCFTQSLGFLGHPNGHTAKQCSCSGMTSHARGIHGPACLGAQALFETRAKVPHKQGRAGARAGCSLRTLPRCSATNGQLEQLLLVRPRKAAHPRFTACRHQHALRNYVGDACLCLETEECAFQLTMARNIPRPRM
jgi:hypothetical protein